MWAWERMQAGQMGGGHQRMGCSEDKFQTGLVLVEEVQGITKGGSEKTGNE